MPFGRKDDTKSAAATPPPPPPGTVATISGRFSMPQAASDRISRLEHLEETDSSAFTSDLSVNEFVLLHKLGFNPLGYVMGTSIYHVGLQYGNWRQSMELDVLTAAMYNARALAIDRMRTEAHALRADGVVGVHLAIQQHAWGSGELEFVAQGTAVRAKDAEGDHKLADGGPFTSDLSGQDFFTLVKAGHFPRSLVFGTCVYHVAHQSVRQAMKMTGQNMEIPLFTESVYTARELAMTRMEDEAAHYGADGIVGVRANVYNHIWGEHATEFLSVGTGVVTSPESGLAEPNMTLSLNG
jgi:uncharacterized protein YbjQ (UPF0145 family)